MPPPLDLLPSLLTGLLVTLQITAGAAVVALASSFLAGLGRLSGRRMVRGITRVYVDVFRGTSALVQLFWAYFALPLLGLRLEAVTVGILVLGLNLGSYGSEIVRSAIRSVSQSQYDAAAALNLSRRQTLWRIILPQAALRMIPPSETSSSSSSKGPPSSPSSAWRTSRSRGRRYGRPRCVPAKSSP